jgi:hypothetical protein
MIFAQLILPNPLGTLSDDLGDDTGLPVCSNQASRGAFVLIGRCCRLKGSADQSPASIAILGKGFLSNADSKSAIVSRAHELHRKMERDARILATKKEPVYVPLDLIADCVIEELRRRNPGLKCNERVLGDPDEWQRVNEPIWRVNGRRPGDTIGRSLFAGWTVGMDFERDVMPIFLTMRESVASFLEIPLGKEDYGTWEEDRQCP